MRSLHTFLFIKDNDTLFCCAVLKFDIQSSSFGYDSSERFLSARSQVFVEMGMSDKILPCIVVLIVV